MSTSARRLREAVIAISVIAVAVVSRLPIAPLPSPGICLTGSVGAHGAVDLLAGVIAAVVGYSVTRPSPRPAGS